MSVYLEYKIDTLHTNPIWKSLVLRKREISVNSRFTTLLQTVRFFLINKEEKRMHKRPSFLMAAIVVFDI